MAGFKEYAHEIRKRDTHYPNATGKHVAMYAMENNRVYIIDENGGLVDFQIKDGYFNNVQISGQCLIVGQDVVTDTIIDGHNLIFKFDPSQIDGNMLNANPSGADWRMDVYSISGVDNGYNQLRIFDNNEFKTYMSFRKNGSVIVGDGADIINDDGHTVQVHGSMIVTGEITCPKGSISLTAQDNESFGKNALANVSTGSDNVAVGVNSMANCVNGYANVAVGNGSLSSVENGYSNVAIGYNAMLGSNGVSRNVAVGGFALQNNQGDNNVSVGYESSLVNVGGFYNTIVGSNAFSNNNSGNCNVAIGNGALENNISGSGNVAIGYFAGRSEMGSNKLYIANTDGTSGDALIYGEFDTQNVWINGTLNITTAIQTNDIVCNSVTANTGIIASISGQNITLDPVDLNIVLLPSISGISNTIDETGMSVVSYPLTSTYGVNMNVAGLISESSIQSVSFVSGGTTSATTRYLFNKNTSSISSYTINFPSSPSNGQIFTFATRGSITTLTWGGGTANTTPTSVSANDRFTWVYNADDSIWMRTV